MRTFCVVHGVDAADRSSTSTPEVCVAPVPVVSVTIADAALESASARLSSVVAVAGSTVAIGAAKPAGAHSAVFSAGAVGVATSIQPSSTPPPGAAARRGVRAVTAVVSAALKPPPAGSSEVRTRPSETLHAA